MRLEEFVQEWTKKGDNDLASAQFLVDMRPVPLEVIGLLLERCGTFDAGFSTLAESCAFLTDFAVEMRYPNSINLDFDTISKALSLARGAVAHVAPKLAEGSD
jgi:hypothetical protein